MSTCQAGVGGGAVQLVAQACRGDPAALVGEQEVGEPAGAGVRQRAAGGAVRGDPVDELDGLVVDAAPSARCRSLPSGTFSQAPAPGTSCTQSSSRSSSSPIRIPVARGSSSASARSRFGESSQRRGQPPVGVGGQVAGQRARQLGEVAGEDQPPGRGLGPAPLGDVVEELADGQDPARRSEAAIGAPVRGLAGGGDRGQVGLDVALPVQRGQRGQRRVDGGRGTGRNAPAGRRCPARWSGRGCAAAVPGRRPAAGAAARGTPAKWRSASSTGAVRGPRRRARRARRGGRARRGRRAARRGSAASRGRPRFALGDRGRELGEVGVGQLASGRPVWISIRTATWLAMPVRDRARVAQLGWRAARNRSRSAPSGLAVASRSSAGSLRSSR